ncbi:VOC family protein [Alkalilimnicola sp. S0819]|uniref:VOC family protein n=1 Tax=Alkalilimnicola sp. S0819 TaxID=2613922 RepID=UPI00126257EA|nr:VOC family protein [Alkalilimnicola sp. S0819]KAB7619516.1 glyoxalase/bleomycin resistance/extradiol dioxygenase family protein [Alkalilimnicola sp. S0819]MPQ17664.1 glyoxalase/bleomycin resistance/extradiol dioxygenase family protein [Alkalilimnicola sp. S0819]
MIQLQDIRYVRLGTGDVDAATEYCTAVLGLEKVRTVGDAVYFRSDSRDHTLVYFDGDPKDHRTAFEIATVEELEQAKQQLEAAGRPTRWGTDAECEERFVMRMLEFIDPTGNTIELVWRPMHSGWRYFPSRDAGITGFQHIGLRSADPQRDERFWTEVCNARVSDWIGVSPLLRIDEIHHKIALFPSDFAGVQHINHQVETVDDIMRSWYFLQERDAVITFGPGRHPTSGARFLYFEGPDGMVYEYSSGVRSIEDEENYRPRQFPFEPKGFCMWGAKPNIKEFK